MTEEPHTQEDQHDDALSLVGELILRTAKMPASPARKARLVHLTAAMSALAQAD